MAGLSYPRLDTYRSDVALSLFDRVKALGSALADKTTYKAMARNAWQEKGLISASVILTTAVKAATVGLLAGSAPVSLGVGAGMLAAGISAAVLRQTDVAVKNKVKEREENGEQVSRLGKVGLYFNELSFKNLKTNVVNKDFAKRVGWSALFSTITLGVLEREHIGAALDGLPSVISDAHSSPSSAPVAEISCDAPNVGCGDVGERLAVAQAEMNKTVSDIAVHQKAAENIAKEAQGIASAHPSLAERAKEIQEKAIKLSGAEPIEIVSPVVASVPADLSVIDQAKSLLNGDDLSRKARKLLSLAVESNNPQDLKDAAQALLKSHADIALSLYEESAAMGNVQAQVDRTYFLYHGLHGMPAQPDMALEAMKDLADKSPVAKEFVAQWGGVHPMDVPPDKVVENARGVAAAVKETASGADGRVRMTFQPAAITETVVPAGEAVPTQYPDALAAAYEQVKSKPLTHCETHIVPKNADALEIQPRCTNEAMPDATINPGEHLLIDGQKVQLAETSRPQKLFNWLAERKIFTMMGCQRIMGMADVTPAARAYCQDLVPQ